MMALSLGSSALLGVALVLVCALAACSSATADPEAGVGEPVPPVVDFRDPAQVRAWDAIDDVVMGGVSSSSLAASRAGTALFTGRVSLERGGGFASVRSPDAKRALAGRRGLVLSCRGDGKRYKLRVRTSPGSDGIAYQVTFEAPADTWIEARFGFAEFVPVFRGRAVVNAAPLDAAAILSFGLMISDGQPGPFRLELARIDAW